MGDLVAMGVVGLIKHDDKLFRSACMIVAANLSFRKCLEFWGGSLFLQKHLYSELKIQLSLIKIVIE